LSRRRKKALARGNCYRKPEGYFSGFFADVLSELSGKKDCREASGKATKKVEVISKSEGVIGIPSVT
jgi:hypothetical protein